MDTGCPVAKARPARPRCWCRSSIGPTGWRSCSPSAAPTFPADLPDHAGQISFPGGRVEPYDLDVDAAALRETEEEIGLPRDRVTLLGHLSDYETVPGYRVTPVVGWVEPPFPLNPDPMEVADVFEVPLSFLLDPTNQQRHLRMLGEIRRDYFAIPFRERYIWGATAAMLMILDRTLRAE